MVDLNQYDDDVVLTTREVAAWLGISRKTVLGLPGLPSLDHLPSRETQFRAGDVKRIVRGDGLDRAA